MRKALVITRKILFWIFFVCLFLVTTLTVILHIYEDDIKQYAIAELNEYLETDMEVMDIELSIFHDFPYASLEFKRVFVGDAFKEQESKDTLFYADRMFLNFSLMDIWNGDYRVKRLSVHNGSLNLRTAASGDVNYDIIAKRDSASKDSSNFKFMLELLSMENIKFQYSNLSTNQFYDIDINEGLLTGDFSSSDYELNATGDLYVHDVKSNAFTLIKEKHAELDLDMDINKEAKSYVFNRGGLTVEEMPFNITGFIDSSSLDLQVVGQNIQLDQLANSLVDESLEDAKKYQGKGNVSFTSRIAGPISKTEMPSVTADFSIDNGRLTEPVNQLEIYDVNLLGHYQNAQEDRDELLSFSHLKLKLLNSYFSGTGEVKDFHQPLVTTKVNGNMDLDAFHKFFKLDNIEKLSGMLKLDMGLSIRFLDPEYRKDQFEILESNGTIHMTDILYNKSPDELTYRNINGDIIVKGDDAAAQNLSVRTDSSDFVINGAMKNLIPYIEGNGSLGLIASLESGQINLNEFLGEPNKTKEGPPTMFELPKNLNLNLEMNIGNLKWEHHLFNSISGKMLMTSRKVTMNHIKLKMLGGNVAGSLVLENMLQNGNIIDGDLTFNGINIKSLFVDWKNFDQENITSEHLSGQAKGKIDFLLVFNPYFSLISDKLYSLCDLTIENGELAELETMNLITDYMRSNKALKAMLNKHIDSFEDKLMHLKFDKLSNKFEIKNGRINIPKMHIKSNALDVSLFGWHDFDNNVEYHFSFRWRELKTTPEYTEFGKIEDDGLGIVIYLTMTGPLDDPEFALDKDERKNDLRENIVEETQTFKSILKTEFGLFGKDSTVKKVEEDNKREVEFIFYKDDEPEKGDTTVKEKNKGRIGKIFDNWKKEQEENKNQIDYESEKVE